MVELLQNVDLSLNIRHGGSTVGLRRPLRPLPSYSLLLFDGWSFCVWMTLTIHQLPVVHAIAFMTVMNMPRLSSCAMYVIVRVYDSQLLRCEVGR
jgi:hypothetical protein